MDWNELIRIWGAGHPDHEEPEIDAVARDAHRARERRRSRIVNRAEKPVTKARQKDGGQGIGPGEADARV